jgi:ribose-phosphate pyrophosphokinase
MNPLLFTFPGHESMANSLREKTKMYAGEFVQHRFPDGESYIRVTSHCNNRAAAILVSLDHPDEKIIPLIFLAETLRELGATKVGLIAPYLSYMRQDQRFKSGEGVTSNYFAKLISNHFDSLMTIDPHLHRHHDLKEIYSIPAKTLHTAPLIWEWIKNHIKRPLLVGPDAESHQWVKAAADGIGAPFIILEKIRRGDLDVEISVPHVEAWLDHTPILIDDIISSGRTLISTLAALKKASLPPAFCIGVHGIFAANAYTEILAAGAARILTCNTIPHLSSEIDVSNLLASAL